MSCIRPLKAFRIGTHDSGKPEYKICSYDTHHVELRKHGWFASLSPLVNGLHVVEEFIEIPCGHCHECRLAYSRQWADRLMLESLDHEFKYFITLTYDDAHLPYMYDDDGVVSDVPTLNKKDVQLFVKRLRRFCDYHNLSDNIRFYCSGEYGTKTARPHYHLILFGLQLQDLAFYKRTKLGFNLFTSKMLTDLWSNGYVVVGEFNWDTAAYCARYVMKKVNGLKAEEYFALGKNPEFAIMSRKPGIARKWFDENGKIFLTEASVFIKDREIKPNRYYAKLLGEACPDWKDERQCITKVLGESRHFHKDRVFKLNHKSLVDSNVEINNLFDVRQVRMEYEYQVSLNKFETSKKGNFRPDF